VKSARWVAHAQLGSRFIVYVCSRTDVIGSQPVSFHGNLNSDFSDKEKVQLFT